MPTVQFQYLHKQLCGWEVQTNNKKTENMRGSERKQDLMHSSQASLHVSMMQALACANATAALLKVTSSSVKGNINSAEQKIMIYIIMYTKNNAKITISLCAHFNFIFKSNNPNSY